MNKKHSSSISGYIMLKKLSHHISYFTSNLQCLVRRENLFLLLWVLVLHYTLGYQYKLIYVFSALSGLLLLRYTEKILYRFIIIMFTFCGACYAPVGINYGFPDVNVIGSLMYTNANEAYEFIANIPITAWLFSASVIVSGIVVIRSSFSVHDSTVTRGAYGVLMIFFFASALWSPFRQERLLSGGLPEVRFVHDIYTSYLAVRDNNRHFIRVMSTGNIWKPVTLPGQHETYILVIGESARRDYLHAFGGVYPNTTWLDNVPATLFSNYISAGPSTVISLTNTLARSRENKAELNNNIVALASQAGFETWWISNQGKKGHFDSPMALIGESADHYYFTKSASSDDRVHSPDVQLLPQLQNALEQGKGKKFIVLHLMGSHPKACMRTNDQYDIDVGAKEISCYIKSIAMTDQLLEKIHKMVEREGGSWSMMYFSDHGLSYINKKSSGAYLTHGDKTRENYEVPFFVINKDQKERVIIQDRRSGMNFLETFSQWMKISDPEIVKTCDMFAPGKCNSTHEVLNSQGGVINYDELPSIN